MSTTAVDLRRDAAYSPGDSLTIRHERATNFQTLMASGMAIGGPTPDGFIHLTFFRDCIPALTEYFTVVAAKHDNTSVSMELSPSEGPVPAPAREDVATILVPVAKFESFVQAMNNRLAMLRQAQESAGERS